MKLSLPKPTLNYDMGNEANTRNAIEQADASNLKRTDVITTLKFRDVTTGAIVTLTVAGDIITGVTLPAPTLTTLGGVKALAAPAHQVLTAIGTDGVPVASALPVPTASTLGGVESLTAPSHQFLTGISTAGVPQAAQPAFSDLSGSATPTQGGKPSNRYTNFTNTTAFTNTTTSFEMGGFGSSFKLTPVSTGNVRVNLTMKIQQATGGGTGECFINYGSGTAPAANAAETGTRTTSTPAVSFDASGNLIVVAHIDVEITGLTLSTTYWFDPAAAAIISGNVVITPIAVIIEEF